MLFSHNRANFCMFFLRKRLSRQRDAQTSTPDAEATGGTERTTKGDGRGLVPDILMAEVRGKMEEG